MRLRILSVTVLVFVSLSGVKAVAMRDGGFSANSDFPNSYLYTGNGNLEWRF